MTKLQIKELLNKHHPTLSSTLSDMYLELSADKIAQDTDMINKTILISSVAGTRWYDLDTAVIKVDKVYFNDVKIPKLVGDAIIDDDEFTNPEDASDTPLKTPTSNSSNRRYWSFSNYDSAANTDDESCIPYIYGCMDPMMWNYNPLANTDNGSCVAFIYGCNYYCK